MECAKALQQLCDEIWSPDNSKPNTHYLLWEKTSHTSLQCELILGGQIVLCVCVV